MSWIDNAAAQLATANQVVCSTGNGTVTTGGTTAVIELGDSVNHLVKLTMTSFVIGTIVSSTSLGIGASMYTLPAGALIVDQATLTGSIVTSGSTKTGTPEIGIGTVIASGAVAVLSGTQTFQNVMSGSASGGSGTGSDASSLAPDLNSTTFQKISLSTITPMIKASGGQARALFLNAAAAWGANTGGTLTFTGVIHIRYRIIS